jgi:hypothetical protein
MPWRFVYLIAPRSAQFPVLANRNGFLYLYDLTFRDLCCYRFLRQSDLVQWCRGNVALGSGIDTSPVGQVVRGAVDYPEPAFRPWRRGAILPGPADQAILDFVSRRVAAMPLDLLSHTKRIVLFRHHGDSAGVFGAVIDLYIATGSKAVSLRRRLLDSCRGLLDERQVGYLLLYQQTGITAETPLDTSDNLLSKGFRRPRDGRRPFASNGGSQVQAST